MSRCLMRRSSGASIGQPKGILAVSPDRLARSETTGIRETRAVGAYVFYSSVTQKLRVCVAGRWSAPSYGMLVAPFTTHCVSGADRITETLIEVESVAADIIDARWMGMSQLEIEATAHRIARAFARLPSDPRVHAFLDFDKSFLGDHIAPPALDPRIQIVVDAIRSGQDSAALTVTQLASLVGLSASRLTHIFRDQVGVPIRQFRAWKRARQVMLLARGHQSLVDLALEAGYADSTHFSHAMRAFFGVQARDFCRRSAELALVASNEPSAGSHFNGLSKWQLIEAHGRRSDATSRGRRRVCSPRDRDKAVDSPEHPFHGDPGGSARIVV